MDCCQPNVRRQATFFNRDTESVVALTPNIKLVLLCECRDQPKHQTKSRKIYPAPRVWHDGSEPPIGPSEVNSSAEKANHKAEERYAPKNHAKFSRHALLVYLVELTGIEPVASWLQTRRSPS
jgi:hypothetical protein